MYIYIQYIYRAKAIGRRSNVPLRSSGRTYDERNILYIHREERIRRPFPSSRDPYPSLSFSRGIRTSTMSPKKLPLPRLSRNKLENPIKRGSNNGLRNDWWTRVEIGSIEIRTRSRIISKLGRRARFTHTRARSSPRVWPTDSYTAVTWQLTGKKGVKNPG